ncbi:hypothetical protein MAHJHV63_55170 [Mycobacterium avium subsp. hominissuis]
MIVVVNEQKVDVDAHTTVAALLDELGFGGRGVRVDVDLLLVDYDDHWRRSSSSLR